MSDPRPPDERDPWPERDLNHDEPAWPDEGGPPIEADAHEGGHEADAPAGEPAPPGPFSAARWTPPEDESALEPDDPVEADAPVDDTPEETPPDAAEEEPATEASTVTTVFAAGDDAWDPKRDGERRNPTTAEQAVPWLIGLVLALAGMVIILVALIFSGPDGLVGATSSPTTTPGLSASASPVPVPSASVAETPAGTPTPEPTPVVTPTPVPTFGPLEMLYLGRQTTTAPVYLLRRDFSTTAEATVTAQASSGVEKFAWAPDGSRGVALIDGNAVALMPGEAARPLASDISAMAFGWDADTVFAVRIVPDGSSDRADVLAIDFASGEERILIGISYARPVIGPDPPLREAQFIDNGDTVRIYATNDGNVVVWILGAPAVYRVDPVDGRLMEVEREPLLWSPDGRYHIALTENSNGTTVIAKQNRGGDAEASVTLTGLVSHIRWAPTRNEIVFTLGRSTSGGGIRQDLYVWDLVDGNAPSPLTSNGAAFGAEWLGVAQSWQP
jgi:hypothetical protein